VGLVFAVCTIGIMLGAILVQPFSVAATANTTLYAYGASVILSLPPGGGTLANRPTVLKIDFWHAYAGEGDFFGPGDVMRVWLWVPANNAFVGVALIQNNQNSSILPWLAKVLNGTALSQNVVIVNPSQMQMTKGDCGVLMINLTTPINVSVGDPLPAALKALNFTLPSLAITVRPNGNSFEDQAITNLPSGYNVTAATINVPAWVQVSIPQWLGATYWMTDGVSMPQMVVTYNAP
jgi:hypothetical protein